MPSSPPGHRHPCLRDLIASPDYFARVSEVTLKLDSARNVADVADRLKEAVALLGADVGVFVSYFVGHREQSYRFFLACDPRWYVEYEQSAWYADDPWLEYASRHALPILSRDIPIENAAKETIVQIAGRYGFSSAIIVPAPAGRDLTRLGMLCLGSSDPACFEGDAFRPVTVAARPLAMGLLDWSTREARQALLRSTRLSPEDLHLLELVWRGLSTKEIAKALDTTPTSLNSRFQRLIAKFGARSKEEAAQLAVEYGLI